MTDNELIAEYRRIAHSIYQIVASVHGVIPIALITKRIKIEAELDRRGLAIN